METAIRFSPNSTPSHQTFLFADVRGRGFNRCRITHYSATSKPQLKYDQGPAFRNKVPAFRALDWASFDEALVAVGTPHGETCVLRIGDRHVDSSGAGQLGISNGGRGAEEEIVLSFTPKCQRPCNAVAFSTQGLLASGLERQKNDSCLNVWDVNAVAPTALSSQEGGVETLSISSSFGGAKSYVEPLRKLASSEAVSSIKFFSTQPSCLIMGVKGSGVRIYDLREKDSSPVAQFHTDCVHNIALDSLREVNFACAAPLKDTRVQIWDTRVTSRRQPGLGLAGEGNDGSGKQQGPVIVYEDTFNLGRKEGEKAGIWSLRFCKDTGLLGALWSNGNFKIFELKTHFAVKEDEKGASDARFEAFGDGTKDILSNLFTKKVHRVERAFHDQAHYRTEQERIVSFDFTNLAGSRGTPTAMFLRGDRSVEIYEVKGPSAALTVSSCGEAAISRKPLSQIVSVSDASAETISLKQRIHTCFASQNVHSEEEKNVPVTANIAEARRLCEKGYSLNIARNINLMQGNAELRSMWTWIQSRQRSS
ncbi:uncharacterized protein KY384_001063 [Bacidia gigantensis]|uniref:uncharacterized protein n=1 Tax=Bacidia gigantensis TaxID=2732470 RepID=UPI001D05A430|nr:uncharacterized protein KY384_001063 [Bacidia gigantensis]KAG8534219.1 hypothetical protein KY384_001063 [Bacidia gigantensis]